jgi:nodulation protein A
MTFSDDTGLQIINQSTVSMTKDIENEINHLDYLAFAMNGEKEEDFNDWAMFSTWHAMGRLGGRLVSQIGIVDRIIRIGAQNLSIAGVGGVATHPEYRRRGFARILLQTAVEQMRQRGGYDFAMLFCDTSMIPYYSASGFNLVHNPVYILQSDQPALFEDNKMVRPLSGKPWPEGDVDLNGQSW